MERLHYSIEIKAPKAIVWEKLWSEETYPIWTSSFDEGSRAESDWKEGSKILFIAGNGHGMVSVIEENDPYNFMSFKHLGSYKDGEEDLESESVKEWSGAMETYRLEEKDEVTTLFVGVDTLEKGRSFMEKAFPKALEIVKSLAESEHSH